MPGEGWHSLQQGSLAEHACCLAACLALLVQATQHRQCRVRVTVRKKTSGKGHKFKLVSRTCVWHAQGDGLIPHASISQQGPEAACSGCDLDMPPFRLSRLASWCSQQEHTSSRHQTGLKWRCRSCLGRAEHCSSLCVDLIICADTLT
jgi:hypothetical protein